MRNNFNKFFVSFRQWYIYELPQTSILKDAFIRYDNWDGGRYYLDIDYEHYYKLNLGIEYDDILKKDEISIYDFKVFLELNYDEFVKDRYEFTVNINNRLRKFNIPYSLKNGKLISLGYKTSYEINYIYNYEQLERKIKYSEELIISKDLLDKKTALDYITDSLQYIVSINEGNGVKKKNESTSLLVGESKSSKVYSVINNELDEVNKIINEYFDIRHNEYLNKAKQKREVLNDKLFIEYLYNRIYSLLFLLRLKCKK
ncbi:hypothetical protein PMZ66_02720 [Clostridium paraputrificum]|nr:hypothetical protein [Clostridium paraputrificum]MDB2077653.1 hypothetical protein [Clostridium paraputrificum]